MENPRIGLQGGLEIVFSEGNGLIVVDRTDHFEVHAFTNEFSPSSKFVSMLDTNASLSTQTAVINRHGSSSSDVMRASWKPVDSSIS
jgi:hypothetical protein